MIESMGVKSNRTARQTLGIQPQFRRAYGALASWFCTGRAARWHFVILLLGINGTTFAVVKQVPTPSQPSAPVPPIIGAPPTTPEPQLREIRDAVHIPSVWDWLTPVLIATGLIILMGLLWWQFRRRKSAAEQIRETAAERARKRLRAMVNLMEDPERFCTALSEIVRVYLEERFRIRAPEQTTEEFLEDTRKNAILDQKHRELLANFLAQCDLVKFAGYQPVREDLARLHQSAGDFVEETAFELPTLGEAIKAEGVKR